MHCIGLRSKLKPQELFNAEMQEFEKIATEITNPLSFKFRQIIKKTSQTKVVLLAALEKEVEKAFSDLKTLLINKHYELFDKHFPESNKTYLKGNQEPYAAHLNAIDKFVSGTNSTIQRIYDKFVALLKKRNRQSGFEQQLPKLTKMMKTVSFRDSEQ